MYIIEKIFYKYCAFGVSALVLPIVYTDTVAKKVPLPQHKQPNDRHKDMSSVSASFTIWISSVGFYSLPKKLVSTELSTLGRNR